MATTTSPGSEAARWFQGAFATGVLSLLLALPVAAGEKYAFLVGVGDYDKKELRPLQYTRNDILELHQVLLDSGYDKANIVLMHDDPKNPVGRRFFPEGSKIREELKLLLAGLEQDDSLIVALSGHGVQFLDEKQNYFCPVDTKLTDRGTLLSIADIYRGLEKCPARQKLLLIDACRDAPQTAINKSRQTVELASVTRPQTEAVPRGLMVLFSCADGQQSFEDPDLKHGVFFYHVLQALKGAADDADQELTLDQFIAFTKKRTQTWARTSLATVQTPQQAGEFTGTWLLRSRREKPTTSRQPPVEPVAADIAVITAASADVMDAEKVLAKAAQGEWFPVHEIRGGWLRIEFQAEGRTQTGWVHESKVRRTKMPARDNGLAREDSHPVRAERTGATLESGNAAQKRTTTVPELISLLKNGSNPQRTQAVRTLGGIGPEAKEAVPELVRALKDEGDVGLREEAAVALGGLGGGAVPAVPALADILKNDKSADVRSAAADALGDLGSAARRADLATSALTEALKRTAVPALIDTLEDDNDAEVRVAVAEALESIGPDAKEAIPALIEAAFDDDDSEVRESAIWALCEIGPDARETVEALKELQQDSDEDVQDAAEDALKKITGAKAADK